VAIGQSLADFQMSRLQCDSLIASAHRTDPDGNYLFPSLDREQITVAAFLNLFIGWEEFIEASITDFMMGEATESGKNPVLYVQPPNRDHSNKMVVHTQRFFDYANHDNIRKVAKLYFDTGYPFDGPLSSINAELAELKTIRNACAHLSSTTRTALEGLATRILGQPQPGVSVYGLLTTIDPRVAGNATTVYAAYRDKLLTAAILIAQG
jgi:hypothetical protein